MNILGIGPALLMAGLLGGMTVALINRVFGISLRLPAMCVLFSRCAGIALFCIGMVIWMMSLKQLSRIRRSPHLETAGVYGLCRNPLYAAFILFVVPGIAFACNELLILFVSLAMFSLFKLKIQKEEDALRGIYGRDFEQYMQDVPRLVPWRRRRQRSR